MIPVYESNFEILVMLRSQNTNFPPTNSLIVKESRKNEFGTIGLLYSAYN
jgi:hypothetical protein